MNLKNMSKKSKVLGLIGIIAVLLLPVLLTLVGQNYFVLIICFMAIYFVAVSGLDIVFGYSGQISLGHAAYFAIGAYGSVMMHKFWGVPVFFTMIIASVIATLIGIIIAYPATKLVFHFLSLSTIAFGEIVYQLIAQSPGGITGNFTGFFTEAVSIFGFKFDSYTKFYYFAAVVVAIFLIFKQNLVNSKTGRALIAIRENSHAADGMGINVRKYKVIAFAMSAFYTAYAGSMYAHLVMFISPDTFAYKQSVMFLTMLLFGGTSSILGPIIGVVSVTLLNEGLRSAQQYQVLIYGVLLLIVILAMPGGIYGTIKTFIEKRKGVKKNVTQN
ncbi:MAG: branched-chain amino acid ABC transporter permease [Clostridiaceae bacterium]